MSLTWRAIAKQTKAQLPSCLSHVEGRYVSQGNQFMPSRHMSDKTYLHALRERTRDRCCTKATLPLTLQPTWNSMVQLYKLH